MTENIDNKSQSEVKPVDLTTAEGVKRFMAGSLSESDWNARCHQVIAANGEKCPEFWFSTVVLSGLVAETSAKWGGTDQIKIVKLLRNK